MLDRVETRAARPEARFLTTRMRHRHLDLVTVLGLLLTALLGCVPILPSVKAETGSCDDNSPARQGQFIAYLIGPSGSRWFSKFSVRIASVDGQHDFEIVASDARVDTLSWSCDGRELAFIRHSEDSIGVYDLFSGEMRYISLDALTKNSKRTADLRSPRFSPDGSRIAFIWGRDDRNSVVYSIGRDGFGLKRISTPNPVPGENRSAFQPAWAPSGRAMAWSEATRGSFELVVASVDGSRGRATIPDATSPSFSPSGERIVFRSLGPRRSEGIWVANANGTRLSEVRLDEGAEEPVWSPTDEMIAFQDSKRDIAVLTSTGEEVRRVATGHGRVGPTPGDLHPSWSPDGKSIAFTAVVDGSSQLFVASATDTSEPATRLSTQPGNVVNPAWAYSS